MAQRAAERAAEETVGTTESVPVPGSPVMKQKARVTNALYRRMAKNALKPSATPQQNMPLAERQKIRYEEERKRQEEDVKREVSEYVKIITLDNSESEDGQQVDVAKWIDILLKFPSPLGQSEIATQVEKVKEYWEENFVPFNAVYSTKRFNIIGWWMHDDWGGKFPNLQALAVVHLSQPYTNALIERIFSRGTWIDGARSQRTLDQTFEMRVLDGSNRNFVEQAKPALDLKDKLNKVDTKPSTTAIDEAIARFATPLFDDSPMAGEETVESVIEEVDPSAVVVQFAGVGEDDDDESGDTDDDEENVTNREGGDGSIFHDRLDPKFQKEVDNVLRYLDTTKKTKKAPPASNRLSQQSL
jgi:hypothetical protein